jgi:hypothetical protein
MAEDDEQEISKLAELFPHSVELTKGQKGRYSWTIKVRYPAESVNDPEKMVAVVKAIDGKLRQDFEGVP